MSHSSNRKLTGRTGPGGETGLNATLRPHGVGASLAGRTGPQDRRARLRSPPTPGGPLPGPDMQQDMTGLRPEKEKEDVAGKGSGDIWGHLEGSRKGLVPSRLWRQLQEDRGVGQHPPP